MKFISNTYNIYYEGFKNLKVGKKLWKIIFIKLFVIIFILNIFVYDKSIKSEYKSTQEKIEFVEKNLLGESYGR